MSRVEIVNGHRSTVHHDGAVDYAITASRLAGIALLIAGAYLGYRSTRPDVVVDEDGQQYERPPVVSPIPTDPWP